MLLVEPELTEIDRVITMVSVTEVEFQEWKPKPMEEERSWSLIKSS